MFAHYLSAYRHQSCFAPAAKHSYVSPRRLRRKVGDQARRGSEIAARQTGSSLWLLHISQCSQVNERFAKLKS